MAQIVGYFADNVVFTEGPFVLVNANGWRIECELRGASGPCNCGHPDLTIYKLRERLGWPPGKTHNFEMATRVCDRMNEMFREGKIVYDEFGLPVWNGEM